MEKDREVTPPVVFALHIIPPETPDWTPVATAVVYVCEAESETVSVPLAVFQMAIPQRMSVEVEEVMVRFPEVPESTVEVCWMRETDAPGTMAGAV